MTGTHGLRYWSDLHSLQHSALTYNNQARQHLLSVSPRNKETLDVIESSIFVLSLDDYTQSTSESDEPTPIKDLELDAHIRNTSSGIAGRNRWYDKCVSIFVESTSRAGGMGEHSPCDGLVVGAMMNYSLSESIDNRLFGRGEIPDEAVAQMNSRTPEFERLNWVVDDYIEKHCAEAEQHALQISDDSDASLLWFADYGTRWVKETGK
jgi:Choline/Carnitine o-acyltransferase